MTLTTTPDTKPLMAALLAAQQEFKAFEKDAKNDHHGFNYASADGIIFQAREALHKQGLVALVVDASHDVVTKEPVSVSMTFTMELVHPESGGSVKVRRTAYAEPGKGRPLDKAMLGAETSALGYWLRGLLMAPRFDANEVSARYDDKYDPTEIGPVWIKTWLQPVCARLGVSADWLRQRLIAGGCDPETVAHRPERWPIEWKARITTGLEKLPHYGEIEKPADPDGGLAGLPQQPPVDTSMVRKAAPAPVAPGGAAPSPAKNGTKPKPGAGKGDVNAQPPSAPAPSFPLVG